MKIKDRAKAKIPPVDEGVYIAVCVGVIDLGEQYSEKFKNYAQKLRLVWELSGETVEVDGKVEPRQLGREFKFSYDKKSSLRQFLSNWNGRNYTDEEAADIELFDQLGKPCQLQVVHSDDGQYANVSGIMGLPKGMPAPQPQGPLIAWDMEQWSDDAFAQLPDWVQERIKKSTEYQKLHAPTDAVTVGEPAAQEAAKEECPI